MKAYVAMRTPEALNDAIERAVNERASTALLSAEERRDLVTQYRKKAEQWFYRDGEQLSIEVDFDANTCTVVPFDQIPF